MVDSENTYGGRVSRMVGWGHWFAFFNIIAAMLIGTRYISQSPWPETLLGQFYLAISWVGHFGFLVFALYLLVLFPLTFVVPSRKLFRLLSVCFASIGLTVLAIDTESYETINLHLTPVVWDVLWNDSSKDGAEWQRMFIVLPIIFLVEISLSEWVWRKQRKLTHKHIGRPISAVFFVSFILSHLIYIWADAYFYNPITSQKSNFPLSYPMTAKTFMEKHGFLDKEEYQKRQLENEHYVNMINYPLDEIQFNRRGEKLNLLIVSVNNLRGDSITDKTMPFTDNFASSNMSFNNHYSSSNDQMGVFGLFYGLPSSYANSIRVQGSTPIMLDIMEEKKYQFSRFSGNNFDESLYSETIFRKQPITLDASQSPSDNVAVSNWKEWLTGHTKAPWFSFIELTTVDNFDNIEVEDSSLSTSEQFKNTYNKSTLMVDQYIAEIVQTLESSELLNSTIIVITSNHGSEFNETGTNSWGSNSNYSQYQLHVPMVIHWPGKLPSSYEHRTSHLDFSTTILHDLLGASSKSSDFSSGRNLFDESNRRWILAGDTKEIALITSEYTTVIDKFGNYKLYDENYKRLKHDKPKLTILMQGLTELKRFYRDDDN